MSGKLTRQQIAWRIAQDIEDGSFVNLGIGMPELVANYLPDGREIVIHSENGLLGMGPVPESGSSSCSRRRVVRTLIGMNVSG